MKKKLLKTTFTEKLEKVTKFQHFKKHINPKKFPSANRVFRCSQNNRQVIIGKETQLKTEKKRKTAKKN